MDDELNNFIERIKNKMDTNPELKNEVDMMVERLTDIFEAEIDLNIKFNLNVENYRDELLKYDEDELFLPPSDETMLVSELKTILDNEEDDLNLSIDPLYLKKGINEISDMLITTYENKLILVPIIKKKNE